ncbi:MAG: glycosyltransferase family 4 protein [Elusimicrobia bacterium]|nr:glycosyltransferase family 4 protein [Elusimicrobiota bacterium]
MSRRRILHVITRLDNGGSAVSTFLGAKISDDVRFEVALAVGGEAARSAATALGRRFGSGSWPVFPVTQMRRSLNPLRDCAAFFQLLGIMFRYKPDIVHTHTSKAGVLGRCAAFAYRILSRRRVGVVHTAHGHVFYGYFPPLKSRFYAQVEGFCAHLADRLVALSESEKRESLERGVGRAAQWVVIHSGVDIPDFTGASDRRRELRSALGIGDGEVLAGFAGRLTAIKGLDALIRAAAILKDRTELSFVLIGEGEERVRLEKLRDSLGLGKKVLFSGFQDKVFEWLCALDIFVHPSLNEGMGRSLVEAQAAGLPVVATTVCGIPDVVHDGKAGLLVPVYDTNALSGAIGRLAGDAALRLSLGAYGKAWVSGSDETGYPRFSTRSMALKLEALYGSL